MPPVPMILPNHADGAPSPSPLGTWDVTIAAGKGRVVGREFIPGMQGGRVVGRGFIPGNRRPQSIRRASAPEACFRIFGLAVGVPADRSSSVGWKPVARGLVRRP